MKLSLKLFSLLIALSVLVSAYSSAAKPAGESASVATTGRVVEYGLLTAMVDGQMAFIGVGVEADGAGGRPLKVPAVHEPVIPSGSGWLVGVIGLLAIGKPLTDRWVFRSEAFARITGLAPGAAVTEAAVAAALAHERGVLKGAPADCRRLAFLNQADAPGRRAAGLRIADLLVRMDGVAIRRTVVGHVREDPPVTAVFDRS